MIAVAGFVLCVGSLAAAVAVGGPEAIARGGWTFADGGDWGWGWRSHVRDHRDRDDRWAEGRWSDGAGPAGSRTLAWSGAHSFDLGLSADVRYEQTSSGPGSVEITGPTRALEHVIIEGDNLRYDSSFRHHWLPKLTVVVRAPNISEFDVSGVSSLEIPDYRQSRLAVHASGDSDISVAGEADELDLRVSGTGDADLGKLKLKRAEVDVSGSGDAIIAPTESAKLEVSGVGDIRLVTRPGKLETDVTGAGKVRQDGPSSPSPSPSPSASPSPTPSPAAPKGKKT
jgi:hypothetical protein